MNRLAPEEVKRFEDGLVSLVTLKNQMEKNGWKFGEPEIEHLQSDLQFLSILAEKMEIKFYV